MKLLNPKLASEQIRSQLDGSGPSEVAAGRIFIARARARLKKAAADDQLRSLVSLGCDMKYTAENDNSSYEGDFEEFSAASQIVNFAALRRLLKERKRLRAEIAEQTESLKPFEKL